MAEKLVNFRMDDVMYHELKMLALKERIPLKNLISDLIGEYVKQHKDGNPQFKLEQFADADFIACPAFYRNAQSWDNYMNKATPAELEKIKNQIILIDHKLAHHL